MQRTELGYHDLKLVSDAEEKMATAQATDQVFRSCRSDLADLIHG